MRGCCLASARSFMYYPFMVSSTKKVIPKKKGRPATGKDPVLTFRSPPELTERIDRHANTIGKPRSEAIRRLVERSLAKLSD